MPLESEGRSAPYQMRTFLSQSGDLLQLPQMIGQEICTTRIMRQPRPGTFPVSAL